MKTCLSYSSGYRNKKRLLFIIFSIGISALLLLNAQSSAKKESPGFQQQSYDIIIENGKIIDGSGNPWYYGDLGIINDRIETIGCLDKSVARRRINATGMFVTPGFIDIHTHSDGTILRIPDAENSVRQGLTTIVGGNCGGSPLPVSEFLENVKNAGPSVNYITLVGHNSVRNKVMGSANRSPDRRELAEMKDLVEESMKAGAFGLSTGLYYTPGNYATTEEVIELAKIVAGYGGIYVSHIRDESNYNIGLPKAVSEAITIGEKAKIRVQISHLKCLGLPVWYKSDTVLQIIEQGRHKGINVLFDQYPYTASSTGLWGAIVPAWAQEGGTKAFLKRIETNETREKIIKEMNENILRRGGADAIYILKEKAYLSDLARAWNTDAADAAIRIQKNGGSGIISYNMTDYDLENYIRSPFGMIGSDGNISSPDHTGHPRSFGTFPRVLSVYVRDKKLLTWEEAVRKMTSGPANQLGLKDRGIIRPGMVADIVIFNPETVNDKADYINPALFPEGILYVIVNGLIVIDDNKHTAVKAGKVLLHGQ
ncbi:MAG TPA: hypothetical protein DDW27_00220 [Bacteroidales bacterium]|nr:hypothetical protein [Bacteroidales bacterium]